MSSELQKRGRGRPRKIAFGSPDVPPPHITVLQPELRLSKAHRAVIHSIGREARIPAGQVLEDVINQGVPQVREMYADLIECRRRLEERNNGQQQQRSNERPLPQATDLGTEGNGRPAAEFDSGLGQEPITFDVERGHEGEGEATLAAYSDDARPPSSKPLWGGRYSLVKGSVL